MKVAFLLFLVMLILILAVYYVGTVSDTLAITKAVQQVGYFLSGRNSSGNFGANTARWGKSESGPG